MSSSIDLTDRVLDDRGIKWSDGPGKKQQLKDACSSMCSWCFSDWTPFCNQRCLPALACLGISPVIGAGAGLGFFGMGAKSTGDMTGWWFFTLVGAAIGLVPGCVFAGFFMWKGLKDP